jgi:hypothetical protein
MLPEEPLEGEVGHPKPPGLQIRLADTLIRARESVLNQWAGIRPSLVINGGLPELDVTAPDDLVAGLNQTLAELQTSVMDDTGSRIDYAALEDSPAYAVYREERLSGLRFFKPEQPPILSTHTFLFRQQARRSTDSGHSGFRCCHCRNRAG